MPDPLVKLLIKVLKAYDISISQQTIRCTVLTHPDFPSMRCISDALDSWKIKHVVIKVSLEKLRGLDVPVIAHLNSGEFIRINRITDTEVHFFPAKYGKKATRSIKRRL